MRLIIMLATALSAATALAGPYDAVLEVEQQNKSAALAAEREAQLEHNLMLERERAQAAAEQASADKARYRAEQARSEQNKARALAADKEAQLEMVRQAKADKIAEEDRQLELEEKRIRLQAMRAKADRANDYIDAELKNSAAQTDVIQSEADSARNVSSGVKSSLEKHGDAAVNESKGLFE